MTTQQPDSEPSSEPVTDLNADLDDQPETHEHPDEVTEAEAADGQADYLAHDDTIDEIDGEPA